VPGDSPLPLPEQSFNGTSVPGDPSFALVHAATFLVFDAPRGSAILGPNPVLETVFDNLGSAVHEAPVYVPSLNSIIVSNLEAGVVPQTIIDLDSEPPSLSEFLPNPPVLGVNGGRFANGTVYWAVAGGNFTYNGTEHLQVPGIYALDPVTREVQPLLNNYFGQLFNSPDDLIIDPDTGDIFFTDPVFGFALGLTDVAPVLDQATYRFRPSTGAVGIVEAEIVTPNGIAMSPDGKTVYISATGVAAFNFSAPVPRYVVRQLGPRSVYAFDARMTPAGKELVNKRAVWLPEEFIDDGLHVAGDGTVVGAAGFRYVFLSSFLMGVRRWRLTGKQCRRAESVRRTARQDTTGLLLPERAVCWTGAGRAVDFWDWQDREGEVGSEGDGWGAELGDGKCYTGGLFTRT
jgi:sugar lactone lactonase YvrE